MTATLAFALVAGVLSTLSPCVLPLLPIVLGAANAEHRLGPLALASGLALSFVVIGLFLATAGQAIGLEPAHLRVAAAIMLVALGLVLAVPVLSERFAAAASPLGGWVDQRFGGFDTSGLGGQLGLGLLLGAVWSPCVGPTLGAAALLASEGRDLTRAVSTMALFGIGAALPLLALGQLSRERMAALRGRLLSAGKSGKTLLGAGLAIVGLLVLSGFDKTLETALVKASPDWLTALTTRF